MNGADIASLGVVGLARAYRKGELSAETAVTWYLDQIAKKNPVLNAYLQVFDKSALEQARSADARRSQGQAISSLDGVPVALKDNIDVGGTVTTNGVGALRERIARETAFVAQQLDNAGCIVLGKLNMDEAALGAATLNPHFGRTDNPVMPGDTPGGSSGGSGAAVSGGLCAAALGTDTLGSVRIPAAYCGVVGLLGTRGMVSRTGVCALSPTLDQVGVLARSVVDASSIYSALCGYDSRDDQSFPSADRFGATLSGIEQAGDVARLRIGRIDYGQHCDGDNADQIIRRMNQISDQLVARGNRVERAVTPPVEFTALRHAALLVIEAEGYVATSDWLNEEQVSGSLVKMLNYGARQPASRIEQCRAQLRQARLAWQQVCEQYDLLMLPTAPQTSFAHDAAIPVSQADFTAPASVAGLPSISLPAGQAADGRYFGVQLVGPPRGETRLLRFAKQFEELIRQ